MKNEYKIGTWVEHNAEETNFIGYVLSLGTYKARVLFVKSICFEKGKLITKRTNTIMDVNYNSMSTIDSIELTEEDVKTLVDFSLDVRDEELFLVWSDELNVMRDNDMPVLVKY